MGEFKVLLIAHKQTANGSFIDAATKQFGGITIGPEHKGRWRNGNGEIVNDTVIPVYLATDDTAGIVRLVDIYRGIAAEDCVYLRHPNGMVQLVGLRD